MAGNHDDQHHEEPLHQAPWVFFVTIFACFLFATIVIGFKMIAHS